MKTAVKNYFAREILSYLSFGDEKLLYVGKPAGVILVPSLMLLGAVAIILYAVFHIAALVILDNILLYLIGLLLVIIITFFLGGYIFLDWLFDFYIVTNKKIIDLHYAPPFSHNISSILLALVVSTLCCFC